MYKILVVALFAACMINAVTLGGYLLTAGAMAQSAATVAPTSIASAVASDAAAD